MAHDNRRHRRPFHGQAQHVLALGCIQKALGEAEWAGRVEGLVNIDEDGTNEDGQD